MAALKKNNESLPNDNMDRGSDNPIWNDDATKELKKIPFFVRGKARKNTEKFALDNGYKDISKDVLYEAKAYYAR